MEQSRHPSRQRLRRRPVKLPVVIVAAGALTALPFSPAAASFTVGANRSMSAWLATFRTGATWLFPAPYPILAPIT